MSDLDLDSSRDFILSFLLHQLTSLFSVNTAAVGRVDRSCGWSIESIGSVGSVILRIFRFFCHVEELEICLVSKFQLCTTLGD